MSNLSELELQNLRHLIGGYETSHCKMNAYAQDAQDVVIIALVLVAILALQNAAICVKTDAICNVLIHAALTALRRVHIHALVNAMVVQVQNTKHP